MIWDWIVKGISHLLIGFKVAAAGIFGRVLATFGLTMVTFNALLPNLKAFVLSNVSGLPADWMQLLGYLNVGVAMSMIFSALTVRMAWKMFIIPTSAADALSAGGPL